MKKGTLLIIGGIGIGLYFLLKQQPVDPTLPNSNNNGQNNNNDDQNPQPQPDPYAGFTITDNGYTTIARLIYWAQTANNVPANALQILNQFTPAEADVLFAVLQYTNNHTALPPDLRQQYTAISNKYGTYLFT